MAKYTIKTEDTGPPLEVELQETDPADPTGQRKIPIDLTNAAVVTFLARTITSPPGTEEQVEASATIVAPATRGIVRVTWTAAMTKLASEYNVEFKILWKSGELDSVPNEGYGQINFQETL